MAPTFKIALGPPFLLPRVAIFCCCCCCRCVACVSRVGGSKRRLRFVTTMTDRLARTPAGPNCQEQHQRGVSVHRRHQRQHARVRNARKISLCRRVQLEPTGITLSSPVCINISTCPVCCKFVIFTN